MARPYTVLLPGGGSMTVNASDPAAAAINAGQDPGSATVYAGGHQTSTSNGTTTYTGSGTAGADYGATQTPQSLNPQGGGGSTVNSGGGTTSSSITTPAGTLTGASGGGIDAYLQAIASGNVAAANEAIRQFGITSGLDRDKFNQAVSQYNQDHGLAVSLQAANIAAQQAGLAGMFNGQPTEAARQFNMTQGLAGLSLAASLNANPFRQAEALYGLNQGGYSPLMQAVAGKAPLPAFQAPSLSAADTRSLGFLANQGGPGSYTQDQSQQWLNGLPAPHQIDWNALGRATPSAQNLVVSGLSQKWGLDPNDIRAIGQATLPAFQAPTLSGRAA